MAGRKVNYERVAREIRQTQLDSIEEALADLDTKLARYEPLLEAKKQLNAAKRALLGGSRATGEGGDRIRQEDIKHYLSEHPGSTTREVADGIGEGERINAVSNHLIRGRGETFLKHDGKWWNRDPKNGINTEEDLEDE